MQAIGGRELRFCSGYRGEDEEVRERSTRRRVHTVRVLGSPQCAGETGGAWAQAW